MIAVGQGFIPYAQVVFERCVRIVKQSLIDFQNYQQNPGQLADPDRTFLIVSLDLLSGLTQGLNTSIAALYQASDPPVLTLLAMCLQVSTLRNLEVPLAMANAFDFHLSPAS